LTPIWTKIEINIIQIIGINVQFEKFADSIGSYYVIHLMLAEEIDFYLLIFNFYLRHSVRIHADELRHKIR